MNVKLLHFFLFILLGELLSCSTQSFNKKIETSDIDLLKEESLTRYNTNRLNLKDGLERDFVSKALIACHQEKITKGLSLLENEMHSQKLNPFYWNALGTCYLLNNDFAKAYFFYELGLEALSSSQVTLKLLAESTLNNNIGLIHLSFHRYSEAYEYFKKANTIQPDLLTPQFNMAQLYIEFNDNDKALEILKKMELKNPDDIDLLYSLSLIYFRKNEFDKSFAVISKIKNDYLNRPDIVGLYAYNLMKKNRLDEARDIIEKRTFAKEYDQRNKLVQEKIMQKLKDQKK